ncbi:MAG: sigma-E processing peptidase SpoIIGA [Clostridia bacterium]|nr:sigma-E processing peptidase SpoIIGA [Clostridia bacterium]
MVVYGDLAFLVNAAVDGALLAAAGLLAGLAPKPARLLAAAGVGGLYGLGYYLAPSSPVYSPAGEGAASFALVALAFAPLPWPRFVRVLGWLWLAAAGLAGLVLLLSALSGTSAFASGVPGAPGGLARLAAGLGLVLVLASRLRLGHGARPAPEVLVAVDFGERMSLLRGLVDSGNRLRDPLSGAPCLVVEARALARSLPAELEAAAGLAERGDWGALAEALAGSPLARRVRLVPYRSLGHPGGLLLAVFAERAEVRAGGRRLALARPLVALSSSPIDPREGCQALVPEALVAATAEAGQPPGERADDREAGGAG